MNSISKWQPPTTPAQAIVLRENSEKDVHFMFRSHASPDKITRLIDETIDEEEADRLWKFSG